MARSLRIKSIEQVGNTWRIRVGKTLLEIPGKGKAALRQWIREQLAESDEALVAIVFAAWLKQDPELDNPGILVGKTATLDLAGNLMQTDGIVRVV